MRLRNNVLEVVGLLVAWCIVLFSCSIIVLFSSNWCLSSFGIVSISVLECLLLDSIILICYDNIIIWTGFSSRPVLLFHCMTWSNYCTISILCLLFVNRFLEPACRSCTFLGIVSFCSCMKQIITGIRTEVDIISWCINWMHARIKITQAKANIYHKCFPLHMVVPIFPIRLGCTCLVVQQMVSQMKQHWFSFMHHLNGM